MKTRIYHLENRLGQFVDIDDEVPRSELIDELNRNADLLDQANETITQLRIALHNAQQSQETERLKSIKSRKSNNLAQKKSIQKARIVWARFSSTSAAFRKNLKSPKNLNISPKSKILALRRSQKRNHLQRFLLFRRYFFSV